jgi:TolB-like protein/class 3 adenylate cyclase/tetratricopeptide (TPR) repeat protein
MERRLAAIFAADIAGYSRLVGLDEAGTFMRLKGLRAEVLEPLITGHNGRIVDYAGDGVLADFQSAVRAVECALAIQAATAERDPEALPDRRITLRIGVHTGDIIADGVYGDAVNVAARLEQLAEPGGVCVSDRVHEEVLGRIDVLFEHGGEPPLKNIAHAVGVWFWPWGDRSGRAPRLLPPVDKPSIAVLPFDNLGGSEEDAAFADGMVEDLTTALARLNWLFVVARTSAFALRGQAVDAREAGRRLGVRYLLEGSVRRVGRHVRVTGQLIDAVSGAHVWADRFDGLFDNILDLQDEIVASTVGAIEPNVLHAEIERTRLTRPEDMRDMRAHHYYLRAVGLMGAAFTKPESGALDEARGLLGQAIKLDPGYAPALALAGYYEAKAILFGRHVDSETGKRDALELVECAVQADPNDPLALGAYGFVCANAGGNLDRAAAFADRALVLNQNSPLLWNFAGDVRMYLGENNRAIECFHQSMRLNPLDSRTITNAAYLAFAYFFLRQPEEAVRWAERAVLVARNPLSYRILAASLAEAGRIDEAQAAMTELLRLQPNSCLRRSRSSNYKRPEDVEFYVEALRKAGAPEEPTGELAQLYPEDTGRGIKGNA